MHLTKSLIPEENLSPSPHPAGSASNHPLPLSARISPTEGQNKRQSGTRQEEMETNNQLLKILTSVSSLRLNFNCCSTVFWNTLEIRGTCTCKRTLWSVAYFDQR